MRIQGKCLENAYKTQNNNKKTMTTKQHKAKRDRCAQMTITGRQIEDLRSLLAISSAELRPIGKTPRCLGVLRRIIVEWEAKK